MKRFYLFFLAAVFYCLLMFNNIVFCDAETVSVSGRIYRSSTAGVMLNDIVVDVTGTKNIQVKTDRNGNYFVRDLPKGGTYTVTVSKAGYSFSPQTRIYRSLTESKIDENFTASVSTYSISGKVLVGGKPVRGAVVMINRRAVKYFTDQDGSYSIDNLEYDGPYEVSVVSDEHIFEPLEIKFLDKDIVYNFEKDIFAYGRVTSLGQGVANVEINVNGTKYKTDKDGFFKIQGLTKNGDYLITVADKNINPDPKSISLKKITQDTDNLNFTVTGELTGIVTYKGKPFKDAVIRINDRQKEYKTGAAGTYKIDKLGLNQEYNVVISSEGYSFKPDGRIIKNLFTESSVQNFDAVMNTYRINVSVKQGKVPVKDSEVSVSGLKTIFKTNENGTCEIRDLTYGKNYTVSVKKEGIKFVEPKQTINKMVQNAEIRFESLLPVSGIITNDGKPIADAIVTCGEKLTVKTNKKGEYILNDLKPNDTYKITASSNNFVFEPETIYIENLDKPEKNKNFKVKISKEAKEDEKIKAEEEAKAAKIKEEDEAAKAKKELELKLEQEKKVTEESGEVKGGEKISVPAVPELSKEEKKRLEKEEKARIKAEKAEQEKKAKEEKARLKAEQEEQKRKAKEEEKKKALELEEQKKAEKEAERKAKEDEKIKAEEEAKAAKIKEEEEAAKAKKESELKLEQEKKDKEAKEAQEKIVREEEEKKKALELEEQKKAEKEAERKAKEDEKIKAEEEAKAAKIKEEEEGKAKKESELKLEQEKKDKEAKEAQEKTAREEEEKKKELELGEQKAKEEKDNSKFAVENKEEQKQELLSIEGRVLKNKDGVEGIQVRLLLDDEERIYLTDKNGFYKIPGLKKGGNYIVTVMFGKETLNLSPKSRTYKKIKNNIKKQNFYVVEKIKIQKPAEKKEIKKEDSEKNNSTDTYKQNWNSDYGIENKNGLIQKEIHW